MSDHVAPKVYKTIEEAQAAKKEADARLEKALNSTKESE